MKILYCIPHLYNSGGMERVLTQKINWLAAHTDHTITVLTTERVPEGKATTFFALDERVRVVELNIDFNADYRKPLVSKWAGHMRRMRAYRRALTEFVVREKADLCISTGGKEIAFLHTLPCRTMAEMHFAKDQRRQLLLANHKGAFWAWLGDIRTRQLVRAVKPLERLVVLTENDKSDWEKAGCTNVICIPNPCAVRNQVPSTKYQVQSTMYNVQRTKTVLAVGRLHEQKGFDRLLDAWRNVQCTKDNVQSTIYHLPSTKEWVLRIVGEGEKRAELEAQIKDMGLKNVVLAGRTEDVASEYANASLFVLSSRYEGLPLVLIEAMWCGVPCVAFDCPHGPAELLADGRGWLVPNGDTEALAAQIVYVLTHPQEAQERAEKAQAYAHAVYSESAIMPRWVELINEHRH